MKLKLTCREVESFILDYVEGTLPSWSRVRFEMHLATCRECRQYLRDYRLAMELGRRVFGEPDLAAQGSVPEDLIAAIIDSALRRCS